MHEPNSTIEVRPTLSIDFTPQDAPPRNEVVFFDTVAIEDPETMQARLASWPPLPGAILTESEMRADKAIAGVLSASNHGRTTEYDDHMWGVIMNDGEYRAHSERLHARSDPHRDVGEGVDALHEARAVYGMGLYVGQLVMYMEQHTSGESAA
ncbi:MAG TPA: hypothetical protein VLG11_05080 [Candidatus Saccharimonadales bacterium]|nr:hypothetical protein [Candidatus Saccharimonadales bacterium]